MLVVVRRPPVDGSFFLGDTMSVIRVLMTLLLLLFQSCCAMTYLRYRSFRWTDESVFLGSILSVTIAAGVATHQITSNIGDLYASAIGAVNTLSEITSTVSLLAFLHFVAYLWVSMLNGSLERRIEAVFPKKQEG